MIKKSIFKIAIILAVGVAGIGLYRNTATNNDYANTADDGIHTTVGVLLEAYVKDEKAANETYLNKVLLLNGYVEKVESDMAHNTILTFRSEDPLSSVVCTLSKGANINVGDNVRVKAVCDGFVGDVRLKDGEILK
ncbi:OB-fold protein [Polluticaenibacter yanchengensis]|uniref:tRNA_anti-like n=1 Tax=Polluticaenibacter yanchengensis TaxID=3014562 RepID=A0ABT4UJB6_9BACT|nr:hypothetical protein [Chitinophagaceae bacterium LY-5]